MPDAGCQVPGSGFPVARASARVRDARFKIQCCPGKPHLGCDMLQFTNKNAGFRTTTKVKPPFIFKMAFSGKNSLTHRSRKECRLGFLLLAYLISVLLSSLFCLYRTTAHLFKPAKVSLASARVVLIGGCTYVPKFVFDFPRTTLIQDSRFKVGNTVSDDIVICDPCGTP